MWRAHQVVFVPESQETMASSRQPLAELPGDHLRLHRHVVRGACVVHQLRATPACPSAPSPGSRGPRCACSSGSSASQRRAAVADQPDLDRIAQADPLRVEVDLHAARLARLGQNSMYGKRGADHQQRVALLDAPPATAGCRAGRCRRWCRGCRPARAALPSSALTIGRAERLGHLLQLVAGAAARRGRPGWRPSCRRSAPPRRCRRSSSAGRPARRAPGRRRCDAGTLRFERSPARSLRPGSRSGR